MNKTIKKIVALGFATTMVAATAAFAVNASTLADYPSPFVSGGAFNGKIILGTTAQTADLIGAVDIAASLQRDSTTAVATTSGSTSVQGGFRLDTAGDRIYLGQTFSVDSVTKDNLDLLSDSEFDDAAGTVYKYTQSVTFAKSMSGGDRPLSFGQHTLGQVDSFLGFDTTGGTPTSDAAALYAMKVDFNKALNTAATDTIGQKITLFGKEYTFSSETDTSLNKVVLYGSSKEVSLSPKDDLTQTISGKDYAVKVIGFSSSASKVTVSVNGVTDSISEGQSKVIGGLRIYAKSVSSWNNGIDGIAQLQLGADKLILQNGQNVEQGSGEDSIAGTKVVFTGNATALTSIKILVNPDSDFKVLSEGKSFTDPVFRTFALQYTDTANGPKSDNRDTVKVATSGSTQVGVTLTPSSGSQKTLYYAYLSAVPGTPTMAASSTNPIYPVEGTSAALDAYVYLTPGQATSTTTDVARYTHLVRITGITTHATQGKVTFKDVLTDATYEAQQGAFTTNGQNLTLTVDGFTYNVQLTDNTPGAEKVAVTYVGSSPATVVYPAITLKGGETFALLQNVTTAIPAGGVILFPTGTPGVSAGYTTLAGANGTVEVSAGGVNYTLTRAGNVTTNIGPHIGSTLLDNPTVLVKEDKDDQNAENAVAIPLINDANGLNAGTPVFTYSGVTGSSMADSYNYGYVDYYGTYVNKYFPTGYNANVDTVTYPSAQMYANVFIAPTGAAKTVVTSTGAVSVNPIAVGMAILDSEATLGSKPYIVVGGPCVNTVAAALLGNPADCTTGFTEGKAKIKLFSDKNALLVAGYSAKDTQGASRVLANYKDYKDKFTGTELEVVTTNLASLSVNNVQ